MSSRCVAPFVLLLTLAVCPPAAAQYRIDTWTTENGLPQSSVNAVRQTRDGFLWISTFGGLVRFDGATFRVYDPANTPGLRTSRFTDLFEDRDTALWASTDGLGLTRYHDSAFTTYTVADGLPDNRVYSVFNDHEGRLVAETDMGLAEFRDGRFAPYVHPYPLRGKVDIMGRSAAGAVWYQDNTATHRFEHGRLTRTVSLPFTPTNAMEDRSGRLWMRAGGSAIASLTGDRLAIYTVKDGLPASFGNLSVSEDRDGTMWFGLGNGGGLARFRDGRFTTYTTADGLPSNRVGPVYEDREGTHWVATEAGLARLTERPIAAYSTADGLESDNTYPILQDRRGDIWIGGWQGLTRYRDGTFTRMAGAFGLTGMNVMSLFEDRDGGMWIGTWGYGVRRVKDGRVVEFPPGPNAAGATIRAIYQGRGPEIWFGGTGGVWKHHDNQFTALGRDAGYTGGDVHVIHEDRRGALWLGTESGLTRYAHGVFTNFGENDGLAGRVIRAIYEDRDGTLWLGTYDTGLFRFRDGRFTRYTTREGLPTIGAFQIIEDDAERFWITSNVGIYRVARKDLEDVAAGRLRQVTAAPYGRPDGMQGLECNGGGQPAGIRARDGRVWFPTQQGVAVFDPASVPIHAQPPPVVITDLLVADRSTPARDRIEIRSGSTTVEFHYAALTFFRPEQSVFKYRMEGVDSDWVDARSQRMARYAQLPYGHFRFRVIAANRDGAWNEEGASVAIVVVPPFWRTTWFAWLAVAAVALAGFGTHRLRLGALERRRQLQETFSRQLIDSQEADRQRIAAGLHDGIQQNLIVIKTWAAVVERKLPADHADRGALTDIGSAATQALAEVREVVHDLVPYHLDQHGLAETLRSMATRAGDAAGVTVICDLVEIEGQLPLQTQISLFRMVQEAANNIVKHSGAAHAWIEMTADARAVRVRIRDDGKGFASSAPARAPAAGGFGLFGMSERARMMGGRMTVDSAPDEGTTITIEVPIAPRETATP